MTDVFAMNYGDEKQLCLGKYRVSNVMDAKILLWRKKKTAVVCFKSKSQKKSVVMRQFSTITYY